MKKEKEDQIFEFSLPKDVAGQVEQLAEELKTPSGKLFKLFILQGIRTFLSAKKAKGSPPKRMKAAKGKSAKPKAAAEAEIVAEISVVVNLADLPPHIANYISIQAANQELSLERQVLGIIEAWYGYLSGDDALDKPAKLRREKRIKK